MVQIQEEKSKLLIAGGKGTSFEKHLIIERDIGTIDDRQYTKEPHSAMLTRYPSFVKKQTTKSQTF